MKAVVIEAPGNLAVRSVDDPTPGEMEALVKVEACGICGTDLHVLRGEFASTRYPIIPGHEFCGEVVAVGSGVSNIAVGDFVAADPNISCGHCKMCRLGRFNLCENWNAVGVGSINGASAELVRVQATNAFRVDADFPRHWATLIEPLSCVVHGLDQFGPKPADQYLIYGAGTMGLLLAQMVRHNGAGGVDMVETNGNRHTMAKRLGADRVATSADEFDRTKGWDVVIDASGAIPAIEDGIPRVARGGTFLMFGVARPEARAQISPFRVYQDEIRIIGSMAVVHSFERALALFQRGVIDSEAMITNSFQLEEYPAAIDTFLAGTGLKIQVTPG